MTAFEKYFGDAYDLVDVIKSTEKSFVALVYDKIAKRLCVMKQRNFHALDLYKTLRDLDSSHLPEIYRLFENDGKLIVIEEHIDGQTLADLLNYQPKILTEQFVTDILLQICDALIKIHAVKIIHRDLTPVNIMVTKENVVKLIDFGIARIFKPDSTTDTEFLGTRGYAAPEQFGEFNLGQTDERTDIFILGTTIKNLLGKNYRGRLVKVLSRCTDLNPAARYQSVPDLVHAVNRAKTFWLLKRIGLIATTACAIFFATQFISRENFFDEPPEKISSPAVNDVSPPKIDDAEKNFEPPATTNSLSAETANQLIDFTNNYTPAAVNEVPAVDVKPLPTTKPPTPQPQAQVQPQQSTRHAKRVKLYLYINGKLSENRSEHSTAGEIILSDDYKNWRRNDKGDYLFPDDWTARLRIENFTGKDLLDPQITFGFTREKISVDAPKIVRSGQTYDVDISLGGRIALKKNLRGNFSIAVKSPNGEQIPLLVRELKVKQ